MVGQVANMMGIARDASWLREVQLETYRAIAETEKTALGANLLGVALIAGAAATLPNASMFIIPVIARLVAIFSTRIMWNRLRSRLEAGLSVRRTMMGLGSALALGGASWAMMMLPILIDPFLHPARLAVGGGSLVGISLVLLLICTAPRLMLAFLGGFSATIAFVLLLTPNSMGTSMFFYIHAIILAVVGFAYAASRQRSSTAEMLVENRRLGEELAESLAHAEFLMHRDPLTGLRNRRSLFEVEWPELRDAKHQHLLTIDLDHFKRINDTYGHACGDDVLVGVADVLRDFERSKTGGKQIACRLGGEEFVVLLSGVERALALSSAELIRVKINAVGSSITSAKGLTVSASIGLVTIQPDDTLDTALRKSDLAMYRAKERGRNRVEALAA
jgi:diguanylate cyclase (GGDEF)-like protein